MKFVIAVVVILLLWSPLVAAAQGSDRLDRRSQDLALPDEYLDPAWPINEPAGAIAPEESDSVENVPLDDETLDAAEREEMERYKQELGLTNEPDDFTEDHWGATPSEGKEGTDGDERRDPAEW